MNNPNMLQVATRQRKRMFTNASSTCVSPAMAEFSVLNLNVGCLGHVDCGKTTLVKALSTTASTACFDKNPQSKERGITIDLGFSALVVDTPRHVVEQMKNQQQDIASHLQFTFVDCPGHASLIKTVIGGAQIIDMMMLVVDITKGIQTQTAECLVIGEITCDKMVIVFNKIDLIPEKTRGSVIEKVTKKIYKTLEKSKFNSSPIVAVAANPGGAQELKNVNPLGIQELVNVLCNESFSPKRRSEGNFLLAVDHCFGIRGQGTVMTGTIIQGCVKVNDSIEIPSQKVIKKVKSIQMFHKPITKAIQGDRIGICITQFDPKMMERGFVCTPNYMHHCNAAIAAVSMISYFKGQCLSGSKFNISLMNENSLAKTTFFKSNDDFSQFDISSDYYFVEDLASLDIKNCYVLLEFTQSVIINTDSLIIGSKLDSDIHANVCRLAFHGKIVNIFKDKNYRATLSELKVFKTKCKEGIVERVLNENEVIVRGLFKKETNLQHFLGLQLTFSTGQIGVIESNFGQSGKVKVRVDSGTENIGKTNEHIKVFLQFKRFLYDANKKIVQTGAK